MDPSPVYQIGDPKLEELWVDPISGSDAADGASQSSALKSIAAAWSRIPRNAGDGGHGWRIRLCPGRYMPDTDGHINLSGRHGAFQTPVIIEPADANAPVNLPPLDVDDCKYLYVLNLTFASTTLEHIPASNDNLVHFENSDHILVRGVIATGDDRPPGLPRIGLKANQCSHLYIEDSEFSGARAYAFAYVAVQYGHIVRSRFRRSNFSGLTLKGGSAYHLIAGNEVSDCRVIGIAAGEGTGFPYLVPPWLHYEAYDIKVVNNVVRDSGCGLSVGGGCNVLLAHNNCYRVGSSRDTILVALGMRGWVKEHADVCQRYHKMGGWCLPDGESLLPNRNIQICNNVILNPDGFESAFAHFGISGPVQAPPESNIPSPVCSENLRIEGNVIWNGPRAKAILDDVENCYGLAARPTLDAAGLQRANHLNTLRPELIDPEHGDFRPVAGGNLFALNIAKVDDFRPDENRGPAPAGDPDNQLPTDRDGKLRARNCAGAYV